MTTILNILRFIGKHVHVSIVILTLAAVACIIFIVSGQQPFRMMIGALVTGLIAAAFAALLMAGNFGTRQRR